MLLSTTSFPYVCNMDLDKVRTLLNKGTFIQLFPDGSCGICRKMSGELLNHFNTTGDLEEYLLSNETTVVSECKGGKPYTVKKRDFFNLVNNVK